MRLESLNNDSGLQSIVNRLADLYRDALKNTNSKASGDLMNFTAEYNISNSKFIISFNIQEYWKYVEYGRKPGKMPPRDAILNWIKIKPIVPRAINGKIPSIESLAYLIQRSIGRNGIRGKYQLRDSMHSADADRLIDDLKQEIVNLFLDKLIDEINND